MRFSCCRRAGRQRGFGFRRNEPSRRIDRMDGLADHLTTAATGHCCAASPAAPRAAPRNLIDQRRGNGKARVIPSEFLPCCSPEKAGCLSRSRRASPRRSPPRGIAQQAAFAGERRPFPLHLQPGPQPADTVDHEQERQQNLAGIVEKTPALRLRRSLPPAPPHGVSAGGQAAPLHRQAPVHRTAASPQAIPER